MSEENTEIQCKREQITVKTDKGSIEVPGLIHPNCPGLAVTMCGFGVFEVTHINSGESMTGRHERMGSALLLLSEFHKIAKAYSFDWSELSKDQAIEKINELGDQPVPFEGSTSTSNGITEPMKIIEWMRTIRMYSFESFFGEFPWEEYHPLDRALEYLQ